MSVRKTTAKTAETTKAAVKTTPVKTEEPKTETAAAKKAPAKKATPVKKETTTVKKTAAVKKTAEKTEVKESVFLQFAGAEYNLDDVKANVKKAWMAETGKKESDISDIQIYVKPEEHAAYYVVNGEFVEGGRKVEL
ncbi:MAG TPA: histone [Candidatus Blautia stercorigallinarum]|uniref:Histone n=1 Tax=Candidatus Blautia stercorigallinarum TaxID=2838501 RepID=A0A9D1TH06_9FIRM|nr:histone [Candidatus Blautia stercorigallinarum]